MNARSTSTSTSPLDVARDDVATAELLRSEADAGARRGQEDLDRARRAAGDAPDALDTARTYHAARDVAELLQLRAEGAARKVDAARELLRAAEHDAAREALALALPRAERAAMFDRCAPHVGMLAACDAVPRVDLYDAAGDDELLADLEDEHARDVARALALRAIRAEVTAQHAAVAEVLGAFGLMGEPRPPVACVPEPHVLALVVLERAALGGLDLDSIARVLASPAWCGTFGQPTLQASSEARPALRGDPAALLDFGRATARIGDARDALAATVRARETPADREQRERNDRVIARAREVSSRN